MRFTTVGDLIEALQQYDEDTEIKVAYQPSYPLRGNVVNVIAASEMNSDGDDDDTRDDADTVFIAIDQDYDRPYGRTARGSCDDTT